MATPPPSSSSMSSSSSTLGGQGSHITRSSSQPNLHSAAEQILLTPASSASHLPRSIAASPLSSSSPPIEERTTLGSFWNGLTGLTSFLARNTFETVGKHVGLGNRLPGETIQESYNIMNSYDERLSKFFLTIEAIIMALFEENKDKMEKYITDEIDGFIAGEKPSKISKAIKEAENASEARKASMAAKDASEKKSQSFLSYWLSSTASGLGANFFNKNRQLIAQTLCANIAKLFANLVDQAYKDPNAHQFPDGQLNFLGRLICKLIDLYEFKLVLKDIGDCADLIEREHRYDEQFQLIAQELMKAAFPHGEEDLLLFHPKIPTNDLRHYVWGKLQPALSKLLKDLYLETLPLSEIDPRWAERFDQEMGIPDAHCMVHALSFLGKTQVVATRGAKIDKWFKKPLVDWFTKKNFREPVKTSQQVITVIKELLLTKSSNLLRKGKILERALMEKLLIGLITPLPNDLQLSVEASTHSSSTSGIASIAASSEPVVESSELSLESPTGARVNPEIPSSIPPSSEPFLVAKIRQLLEGQTLTQVIHILRNPGIASSEQSKSIVLNLLTLFGWNTKERFPLPSTLTNMIWDSVNEFFQVSAPEILLEKLQWEPIQSEEVNRAWVQENIPDPAVVHAMDGIILKLDDVIFELIKAPSTLKQIIKKLRSIIPFPFTKPQKTALEAQWKMLFANLDGPLVRNLKIFISSIVEPLCYQLLRDVYAQYLREASAANSSRGALLPISSSSPTVEAEVVNPQEIPELQSRKEFNVWFIEKLVQAFDPIATRSFSEEEKAALRRAKKLQEELAIPVENDLQQDLELDDLDGRPEQQSSSSSTYLGILRPPSPSFEGAFSRTPKEELKSQWLVVKPRFERMARSLLSIFGYTSAASLPLPPFAKKSLWEGLSEILFENGNNFVVTALDAETEQTALAQQIEDPSVMAGFHTAITILSHLIGSKLTAEGTLNTLKEALSAHAEEGQINAFEALWNGLFPTLTGPHPDNYLLSNIATTFNRLLHPQLLKIVFRLHSKYLAETVAPITVEGSSQVPRKEFTIWLIETFTTVLNGLNFNQFSPDHRVVLKRAIGLKNALKVATDPQEKEQLKQALKADWKILKPQFKQIAQEVFGVFGIIHQTDLPGSPSLQKILWEVVPKVLFDQMSDMILPFLEKEECLDALRGHEHGELMIQLCRSVSTDIVNHLPEYVSSYETVVREFNATDDLPCRLNNEDQIFQFTNRLTGLIETKQLSATTMFEAFETVLGEHVPYTNAQKETVLAHLRVFRKKIKTIAITPEKIVERLSLLGVSPEIKALLVQQIRRLVVDQEGPSQPIKEFIQSYAEVMLLEFCRGGIHLTQADFEAIITSFQQTRTQVNAAQPNAAKEIIDGFIDQILTRLGVTSILNVKGLPFSLDKTVLTSIKEELSKKLLGMHQLERRFTERLNPLGQAVNIQIDPAADEVHDEVHLEPPSDDDQPAVEPQDSPGYIEQEEPVVGGMEQPPELEEQGSLAEQTDFEKTIFYLLRMGMQKGMAYLSTPIPADPAAPAPLAGVELNQQVVKDTYDSLRETLALYTEEGYQSAEIAQAIADTGILTPLLRKMLQDINTPENAIAYPENGAKLLTPVVAEKFQRILTTLVDRERIQGSDFHQNLLKEMLTVFNTHLRMINDASQREGSINFTNYRNAHMVAGLQIHPAVPTAPPTPANRRMQFGHRKDGFFTPLLDDVVRLLFPVGLQELKDLVKDIASPEIVDKIFENGKNSASDNIAKKLDAVFRREGLVKILNSVLGSVLAKLREPIVFTAAVAAAALPADVEEAVPPADGAAPIPVPVNEQLNGEVDALIGQCVTGAVQLFEVPLIKSILGISPETKRRLRIDRLESNTYQSIGNAIRRQFQANPIRQGVEDACREYAAKVDNNGAVAVAGEVPPVVNPGEVQAAAPAIDPEQRLRELKKELVKELVLYPLNYLGAYIRHLTTTQYLVVNAMTSLIVGVCSFVITRIIGNSLRMLKLDRLSEIYIEELLNNLENRLSLTWTSFQINENLIYQEIEAFKRVMNENPGQEA